MPISEHYWSSARTDSVNLNDKKTEENKTKPASAEKPQMTEMPRAYYSDLVKQPEKKEAAYCEQQKINSAENEENNCDNVTDSPEEIEAYNYYHMMLIQAHICGFEKEEMTIIENMIKKHPETIDMLRKSKDSNGDNLFRPVDVCDIVIRCREIMKKHPDRVQAILDSPDEMRVLEQAPPKFRGSSFIISLLTPASSTVEANPDAFSSDIKEKTPYTDFLDKPSFPEKFNKEEFEKWAEDSGLTMEKCEYGYKMINEDGLVVRRTFLEENGNEISLDKIVKHDVHGKEKVTFVRDTHEPELDNKIRVITYNNETGGISNISIVDSDGKWYGTNGELLENNPLTEEEQ